jgi:hypothetical protein
MSPFAHGCSPLCDDCLAEHFSWYAGIAYNRGADWARAVATVVPIDRPWPNTEKQRDGARRKASSLTNDARLIELLADEVTKGAARWWNAAYERAG